MLFWTTIRVAIESLLANGLRSFLAMLGIIIGVGAVVSMLAVGAGAQNTVTQRVTNMGTNLLSIRPEGKRSRGVVSGNKQNLTLQDAEALLSIDDVAEVSPIVREEGQVQYLEQNARASLIGAAITYFSIHNLTVEKGRPFTEGEVERGIRVVVIGASLAETLFISSSPVGKLIRIDGKNFNVVGVLKAKGDGERDNPDEAVIVPYKVAMKSMFGETKLKDIDVCGKTGCDMTKLEASIYALFRKQHKIQDDAEDDIRVFNQAEMLETASEITQTFTILLGSIASISMLVGGIGIMNMMLLTVTQRTREIGVRKAIGAQDYDILWQFVLEAILISGLGGVVGILFGFAVAQGIETFTNHATIVETQSVLFTFTISVGVGVFFGFYPAYQAAQLDPIDALRYE